MIYKSRFQKLSQITMPAFSETRVLMMPLRIDDIETVPNDLAHYKQTIQELIAVSPVKKGVAYLTIDERQLNAGQTLRKRGLHVDGLGAEGKLDMSIWAINGIQYQCDQHWNDSTHRWYESAAGIGGMLMVSTPSGCRAWNKDFDGRIEKNGSCEELKDLFPDSEATLLEDSVAYWCSAACVHESVDILQGNSFDCHCQIQPLGIMDIPKTQKVSNQLVQSLEIEKFLTYMNLKSN